MQVDSNKKSPRDVRWGGWCLHTCENGGTVCGPFKGSAWQTSAEKEDV